MRPIFLDRDGVINREPSDFGSDYVRSVEQFEVLPRVAEALKLLIENGYDVYLISNQAGVSKGFYSEEILNSITSALEDELHKYGVKLKDIKYCLHQDSDNCECRKPKTKMFEEVMDNYSGIGRANLFYIGDTKRDVESASNFGISSILVLSGKTKIDNVFDVNAGADFVAKDLHDAVKSIILK
ncbi:MAG: HAD-IIIA family hydrolase [Candidatus Kaelpia aquatica]|nr:HAD-IIIA family hydrolase [Candidatus Kaelpia aquatica]